MKHIDAETEALREDFKREIQDFLDASGVARDSHLTFHPDSRGAEPVYFLTGASFTKHDEAAHGDAATHSFTADKKYLMNNTATLMLQLLNEGKRILVHSSNPALAADMIKTHPKRANVTIIGGDLADAAVLKDVYAALDEMSERQPISTVKMALYQSFAQNTGSPFKPMHQEGVEEVERAASRRLRFVFNMAALSYDLVVNRNLEDLRIASLSSLASNRASYGLMADAADKFMNELAWHTFHIEANVSTEAAVSVYQINPGITTSGDVYRKEEAQKVIRRESIADGFPLDKDVLKGEKDLPQLSARDVAWVTQKVLDTPYGEDPNKGMPKHIKKLLYGGFTPKELKRRFNKAVKKTKKGVAVDPGKLLPEHIIRTGTEYGALPVPQPGDYKRISLCPPGQRF